MLQYVVASHGGFAAEGLKAAAMIFGKIPENFHVLSVSDEGDGIAGFEEDARALAQRLKEDPILILADLFGGSPFMTLLSAFRDNDYKLVSGFNLPMLIEAFSQNGTDLTLEEAAEKISANGQGLGIQLVDKIQ